MKIFQRSCLPLIVLLASAMPAAAAPEMDGDYLKTGFDVLAGYKFVAPPMDPVLSAGGVRPTGEEQIPAEVKALNGRKVVIQGYMIPVKMEGGLVTEFIVVSDPLVCCYGNVPEMNEWIVVKMTKGVQPLQDVPLSFYGKLKVGAMFENDFMVGIYYLDGDRMEVPAS